LNSCSNETDSSQSPCIGCDNEKHCGDYELACKDYVFYFDTFKIREENREPNKYFYYKLFPPKKYKESKMVNNLEVKDDIKSVQSSVEKKCWNELDNFFSSNSINHIDRAKLACATLGVLMNEKKLQAFLDMKKLK
jgi:hypothetical protein